MNLLKVFICTSHIQSQRMAKQSQKQPNIHTNELNIMKQRSSYRIETEMDELRFVHVAVIPLKSIPISRHFPELPVISHTFTDLAPTNSADFALTFCWIKLLVFVTMMTSQRALWPMWYKIFESKMLPPIWCQQCWCSCFLKICDKLPWNIN